ncbi:MULTISPECIES: KH domain-containing protein [Carboxydocella]|uniref:RNA-binding protein KhpA n=2 Tax=Carboxydocella TaxID=178898 RepID=A0A1T4PXZ4_9FIRM|nr:MULTISPECIES: KH domain-containing protein [Carboxydocella]AVX20484.1 hypothetical protein CFE_1295 [Carboxydocella thermautotrophica]AVX30905.1 hypothetical protein CTH_1315 [Carboxydocella thermautotrophica]SJZ96196.1 hypothetical protein SAMN02745885_01452 [Carboxydocella sporoproducens DSM 16521]GAW29699.1 hypothetical protein ULO1_22690 [Carboxydocella sp. ULO1]GAW32225.1 hypothetical protein JDF658_19900 [Carboxydocella sp. JDF658]
MKELVETLAKALVEQPDQVTVLLKEDGDEINISLSVAPDDMGKIIGKQGRIAKALRTVVKAAATREGKKVNLDIL